MIQHEDNKMNFISLASGSSGNCYYLGNEKEGTLVDAGISTRRIVTSLKEAGIPLHHIMGILVTHNHHDHVKSLGLLTRKHHIPVFTTRTIWNAILGNPYHNQVGRDCIREIVPGTSFFLAGWEVEAFTISHDTPETVGFHLTSEDRKVTIVTDLGHICENAARFICQANFLVIESNYDEEMLEKGPYPYYLKQRIRGNKGHLSNTVTAGFLADNYHPGLSHIYLAHLSKENNRPDIALQTLREAFREKGIPCNGTPEMAVLSRGIPTPKIRVN